MDGTLPHGRPGEARRTLTESTAEFAANGPRDRDQRAAALDLTSTVQSGEAATTETTPIFSRRSRWYHGIRTDPPRSRARLSFASEADIVTSSSACSRNTSAVTSRRTNGAFRLVRGTYGQRQAADAQMLRVKIPQGVLTSAALRALAEVGERYSRKFGHITTRQNIQFHFVKLHDVEPAMRLLADAGMTTREACGNSVRNITTCPYAGVSGDEAFDVTPYAEATTRFLLRHRLSSTLPRKFKIAFEGCPEDHTAVAINDLAFHGELGPDGTRGFRVMAGGGTAIMCKSAGIIHEFLPASEILRVCEAVLRVFKVHGDYQHKQRNRMKFMIKELGWDAWYQAYLEALEDCRREGVELLKINPALDETPPSWEHAPAPAPNMIVARVSAAPPSGPGIMPTLLPVFLSSDESYLRWRTTNVRPQKQFGFVTATATIPLGDFTSEQMRVLAELSEAYADGSVRITVDQDLVFRWVGRRPHDLTGGLARRASGWRKRQPWQMSPAARRIVPAGGDAVARLGRLLEEQLRAADHITRRAVRTSRSVLPEQYASTALPRSVPGSVRRVGGKPVPQHFVMISSARPNAARVSREPPPRFRPGGSPRRSSA